MIAGCLFVLSTVFALWMCTKIFRSLWREEPQYDETYTFQTRDGWTLCLYRYRSTKNTQQTPIALCHGAFGSPLQWELGSSHSWARLLTCAGYDVWSVELRGCGSSEPRYLDSRRGWGWGIEEHLVEDLPSVLETILRQTGKSQLHWLGHGLGGLLMTLYLARTQDPRVRSCVHLGTPKGKVAFPAPVGALLGGWIWPVLPLRGFLLPWIASAPLLRKGLQRAFRMKTPPLPMLRPFLAQGMSPTSTTLIRQWFQWLHRGELELHNNQPLPSLKRATTPTMFVAGESDRMAPLEGVKALYKEIGATRKSLNIIGTGHGHSFDYAHFDLLLSPSLGEDLLPLVLEWFTKEDLTANHQTQRPSSHPPSLREREGSTKDTR